jgi:hypothetical protein
MATKVKVSGDYRNIKVWDNWDGGVLLYFTGKHAQHAGVDEFELVLSTDEVLALIKALQKEADLG